MLRKKAAQSVNRSPKPQPKPPQPKPFQPANWQIAQLPGISPEDCNKLLNAGIHTTFDLLKRTQTEVQRRSLSAQLQIHPQHISKWAALAQLSCIPAVGCQYCGLLLHAGVATPSQLAQTPLPRLHQQILKLQVATLQRQDLCPDLSEVAIWIQQAKQLNVR